MRVTVNVFPSVDSENFSVIVETISAPSWPWKADLVTSSRVLPDQLALRATLPRPVSVVASLPSRLNERGPPIPPIIPPRPPPPPPPPPGGGPPAGGPPAGGAPAPAPPPI
ncbi:MAG: hypothetical protein DMF69_08495 [Acidobacteria bacterium]|nr:MAG: hypothetical protein DMF69_08495 [Acidobacteriota bacterium]